MSRGQLVMYLCFCVPLVVLGLVCIVKGRITIGSTCVVFFGGGLLVFLSELLQRPSRDHPSQQGPRPC